MITIITEAAAYVTYSDLFAYTLVIITLIGIFTNKKEDNRPTRPRVKRLVLLLFLGGPPSHWQCLPFGSIIPWVLENASPDGRGFSPTKISSCAIPYKKRTFLFTQNLER